MRLVNRYSTCTSICFPAKWSITVSIFLQRDGWIGTWKSCIDFKLLWWWFLSGSLHLLVAETCTSILTIILFELSRVLTWNSYYIGAEGIPQSKLNLQKILQALQQAFFFEAAFSVPSDSVKASWIIGNLWRTLECCQMRFPSLCLDVIKCLSDTINIRQT